MLRSRRRCPGILRLERCMPWRVCLGLVTGLRAQLLNCDDTTQRFGHVGIRGIFRPKGFFVALAVVVSMNYTLAFGSYITMVTGYSVIKKAGGPVLVVTAENRGDEPAYAVQSEVIADEMTGIGPLVKIMQVDENVTMEYSLADVLKAPGRYPIVIRTYYEDANGYRFTALTVGFYDYNASVSPAVSINGHAIEMPVDGKGQLVFVLRNEGRARHDIDLELYLPNELSTPHARMTIGIGPRQEETVVYEVENFSALANSSYQVSLLGRYLEAGNRLGVAGSAVVRIRENDELAGRPIWIWLILGGILPGVIAFLRLKKQSTRLPGEV